MVIEQELEDSYDYDKPKLWFSTGELRNLPTEIYSDCTLSKIEHQKILRSEPRNAEVDYQPDGAIFLTSYVKATKGKILYNSKPDDEDTKARAGYELLQKSNHNARELLRDALSYANDYRRNIALKAISPSYTTTKDKKEVFGEKLKGLVEEENTKSKLYNDANKERQNQGPHKEIFKRTTAGPHEPDEHSDSWIFKEIQTQMVRNIQQFMAYLNHIKWLFSRMELKTPIKNSPTEAFYEIFNRSKDYKK
ncbi:20540_t:CDS:2 [Dentiscutata erythropus]|uniref:20540_t:CDS:1 n=1 Tax=Dentiscutata erythropus TaxID=1348616 RepID=A0A9N9A2I5_9GLOM|nr:20540_t:CDS:2 [Dentiscutata erythropus]